MEAIEKYFKEKADNLTFIELKDKSCIELNNYVIKDYVPLPILTSKLIIGIKEGGYEEEIRITDIIEGIIYIMGTDSQFPYIKEYKDILNAFDKSIKDYIFYDAIKDLEEDKFDDGCIKLRALLVLDCKNVDALYNYSLGIEALAKKFMEMGKENWELFLNFSTRLFESILEIDKDFSLAHYKLGYHYLYYQKYLKASLTWEKFISISENELLIQEIRNEIDNIKDDVLYETGLTYLIYNEYEKSLDYLMKLLPRFKDNWNLNLLIGKCYNGLAEYDLATKYISIAIGLNKYNPDLYNELGIIYCNSGEINKAIEVFTKGISLISDDYKLFYNRGMSYIQLGEFEKSLDDINEAYALEPSDEIKAKKEYLHNIVDKKNKVD